MKTCHLSLVLAITVSQFLIPADFQQIQGRHIRPYPDKCDRGGRCPIEDSIKEVAHDDLKPEKVRPPILTPDGYPAVSGGGQPGIGHDYKPKPIPDYEPEIAGGHNTKPTSDTDDYDSKPDRSAYDPRPAVITGYDKPEDDYVPKPVGYDYNPKPIPDNPRGGGYNHRRERLPKPSGGGGGGYNPKPVRGGNRGHNPRPISDEDDYDIKPVGGGYNPKPTGGRDNYRPGGGGGYNPKPVGGRDDDRPVGGGGYIPKPVGGRDDVRPVGPGGYKPGGGRDDELIPGGGNRPKDDDPYRRPVKPDLGGYKDPKDDYNDYDDGGVKDDDYEPQGKPLPTEDSNCICVPYYQCLEGHIVTDGSGIIDARKRPEPAEDLPLDGKFKPPSCGPFHVCCNTPETSTVKPYEHRCGVRNPSGINSRILSPSNKGEADFGEWPWQAAVLKTEGKVNIFQCGGVLIDKYHVLTVAHCVFHLYQFNEYPLKVRLGEWDTQKTTEFLAHEDYKVSKIIVHPEFRNTSLWNDIALLRLEDPVLFAPHIDTVCLPQYDEIFAGQNCVVTGWGKDAYKGGTFSNVMKEVAIGVIDNYKCEEMLRKTRLGRFFQLHEGFVCAGGEYGLDSCKGDGGGPLVCYRKDKSYALAGIVSWGIDCGQPGVPGVYVKIQKYVDWISKNTGIKLEEYWPKH